MARFFTPVSFVIILIPVNQPVNKNLRINGINKSMNTISYLYKYSVDGIVCNIPGKHHMLNILIDRIVSSPGKISYSGINDKTS